MKKTTILRMGFLALTALLSKSNLRAQEIHMTQCTNPTAITTGNSVGCSAGVYSSATSFYRVFKISDFITTNNFYVDSIYFGVEMASSYSGSQPVTVNLYSLNSGTVPTLSNITLLNSFTGGLSDMSNGIITVPISATIAGTGTLVVEIANPDGYNDDDLFYIGTNNLGETSPSYIYTPDCGVYDITAISTLGVASPVDLLIDVFGRAAAQVPGNFVNPTNPVCDNSTVSYTVPAVAGVNFNWTYSGTGATITPTTTNTASVVFASGATSGTLSVTATNSVSTSTARTLALTVNPKPAPTVSRGGNVLTAGGGTFSSYAWYKNNIAITGATASTYTLTSNGNYFVKVGSASCTGNSDTVAISDVTTAINDVNAADAIKIFPNPTKNMLHIDSRIPVNASLYTLDGRLVIYVANAKSMDIKSLNAGIYYISLSDKDGNFLKREKVIKMD
jgi:hypothetical protein